MSLIDWGILIASLLFIVIYGVWKSSSKHTTESFLRGTQEVPWYTIGFSIMATQASAITFLSLPGQAFEDGMRFIQIYFGLPIAMVILCITFVPMFHKMGCYTAYEFLEKRFDVKTRSLGAILFLIQRGLSTSLTIFAPALVLSAILGWSTLTTNILIGTMVIIYTVSGGTKAVSYTQKQQMTIILSSMLIVLILVIYKLPSHVSLGDAVYIAGALNKFNLIDLSFDLTNKYNIWSGVIGGLFLSLSYFGTDHSQVSRYLTGSSITESRLGLIMNGLLKIPMQFFILFIGVMVFVFYLYTQPPLFFNPLEVDKIKKSALAKEYADAETNYTKALVNRKDKTDQLLVIRKNGDAGQAKTAIEDLRVAEKEVKDSKKQATIVILKNDPKANDKDTNYMFLSFVISYLPVGMIGLLLAVIFAASMSSTASALNSLASVSIIDVYKRSFNTNGTDKHYLLISRLMTAFWGIFAIFFAEMAGRLGSLIEAVNVLGSLFYGAILGLFIVAFYIKSISGTPVFLAAILTEGVICGTM
jgi:Na+/proline symporter